MTFPAIKRNVFILEGLNGFASSIYFNYLFFFLTNQFGFGARGNLLFCAANGLIYAFGAYYGGKFAQRRGYFTALNAGWITMILSMLVGFFASTITGQFLAMVIWTVGVCVTWPSLEALTCEGESAETLPRKVGIYNVVWSLAFAAGLFSVGMITDAFGPRSMFVVPALLHAIQLLISGKTRVTAPWGQIPGAPIQTTRPAEHADGQLNKRFLRMAWLANPFAYVAMNTVIPLIPQVAHNLHLSNVAAGFFGSIWMFARTASFFALWKWTGWHYRFNWLFASYALMIATFAAILLFANLWLLIAVQIIFGFAVGLIYYSSLFYSMDASDTKGEHGGVHEAAIGAGLFLGPAIGFTALQLMPRVANSSALAVSAVLVLGLAALLRLRKG